MPFLNKKRQVTLTPEQCLEAGIKPGDDYVSFASRKGIISIVTKRKGAAKGLLKGVRVNPKVNEEESLNSCMR